MIYERCLTAGTQCDIYRWVNLTDLAGLWPGLALPSGVRAEWIRALRATGVASFGRHRPGLRGHAGTATADAAQQQSSAHRNPHAQCALDDPAPAPTGHRVGGKAAVLPARRRPISATPHAVAATATRVTGYRCRQEGQPGELPLPTRGPGVVVGRSKRCSSDGMAPRRDAGVSGAVRSAPRPPGRGRQPHSPAVRGARG